MSESELEKKIRENAAKPKSAKGDAGEFEQHSLPDQIEADRYLASKEAMRRRGPGIKITKMCPPGA